MSDKAYHITIAFMLGILAGAAIWYLTVPPLEVQYTYLHTTACEYFIEVRQP